MKTSFALVPSIFTVAALLTGCASHETLIKRTARSQKLLVHLPLTESIADSSGNGVPVRIRGVTIRDGAAWFDGKGSYLALPRQPLDKQPFAIAMWVKVEGDSPTCGLAEQKTTDKTSQHFHLMLRKGTPHLGFYNNDLRTSMTVTPADGWNHLIFQYTGKEQEIWVNGKKAGHRMAKPFVGKSGEFFLGKTPKWGNVPSRDFQGGMRNFRLYGRSLSPVEIDALARDRL